MNFQEYLRFALSSTGKVAVPGFGVFSLKNSSASYNNDNSTILPPSKSVSFSTDYLTENDEFTKKFSEAARITEQDASQILRDNTDYWKAKLAAAENFSIDGIGKFVGSENGLEFIGKRLDDQLPEYYGLEKIAVSDLKLKKKSRLPVILLLSLIGIASAAIIFFAIFSPETIFGKKSFSDGSLHPKNIVPQQVKLKSDSVKTNTVANNLISAAPNSNVPNSAAISPVVKNYPQKKYYRKAYKKVYAKKYYKKTQWKQRRRRNR